MFNLSKLILVYEASEGIFVKKKKNLGYSSFLLLYAQQPLTAHGSMAREVKCKA